MLLNGSSAVTVKVKVFPAVVLDGALTKKWVAAAGLTAMVLEPVLEPALVSVAVIVWNPAVFNVPLKVPTPLLSVALAGRVALASLLVKWMVPV